MQLKLETCSHMYKKIESLLLATKKCSDRQPILFYLNADLRILNIQKMLQVKYLTFRCIESQELQELKGLVLKVLILKCLQ